MHFRLAVLDTVLVREQGEIVLAGRAATVTPRSAGPGFFGGGSLGLHGDAGQWRVVSVTNGSRRKQWTSDCLVPFLTLDVLEIRVGRCF